MHQVEKSGRVSFACGSEIFENLVSLWPVGAPAFKHSMTRMQEYSITDYIKMIESFVDLFSHLFSCLVSGGGISGI